MRRPLRALFAAISVLTLALPAAAADRVVASGQEGLTVTDLETGEVLAQGALGQQAQWFPDGQRIAYRDESGIWTASVRDGLVAPRLVVAEDVRFFDLADDARLLVYAGESSALKVQQLDGTGEPVGTPTILTTPGTAESDNLPSIAPDSSAVVFSRLDGETRYTGLHLAELSFIDPGTATAERPLMSSESYVVASPASWFPDGTELMVAAQPRLGQVGTPVQLYRVRRSTGVAAGLVTGQRWQPTRPVVGPDGTQVAYERQCVRDCTQQEGEDSAQGGVWIHDTVTGTERQAGTVAGYETGISWTSDGERIVFEAGEDDSGCHCLVTSMYVVATDGASAPILIDGVDAGSFLYGPIEPAVSPGVAQQVSGPSRVETAIAASRQAFNDAGTVVIARSDDYADALAGAALAGAGVRTAGAGPGPLLLSPTDALPESVVAEIVRLDARNVVLLGDETALSAEVEAALRDTPLGTDLTVERIAGSSRFGTAAAVAAQLPSDHAYVVLGGAADPDRGWPDAVATAGLAALQQNPLLLVETDRLPAETVGAIRNSGITSVSIVGGTAAVSEAVEAQIRDLGVAVERIGGATRYETSRLIAERSLQGVVGGEVVWVATGRNWPDTLAAGPASARNGAVLLLVDGQSSELGTPAAEFLSATPIQQITVLGGADVVTPTIRVAIERTQ